MEKLKIGDKVYKDPKKKYFVPREDIGKVFTVRCDPLEMNGEMWVLLENCRDFYHVGGLTKI